MVETPIKVTFSNWEIKNAISSIGTNSHYSELSAELCKTDYVSAFKVSISPIENIEYYSIRSGLELGILGFFSGQNSVSMINVNSLKSTWSSKCQPKKSI